jgi:hypothetical protein
MNGKRWIFSAKTQRAKNQTRDGTLYILLQRNFPLSPRLAPVPDALRRRAGGGRLHRHRRRPRDRRPPLLLLHRLEQNTKFESEKEQDSDAGSDHRWEYRIRTALYGDGSDRAHFKRLLEPSQPNLAQKSMEEQSAEHTSGVLPVLADSREQSSYLEDTKSSGEKTRTQRIRGPITIRWLESRQLSDPRSTQDAGKPKIPSRRPPGTETQRISSSLGRSAQRKAQTFPTPEPKKSRGTVAWQQHSARLTHFLVPRGGPGAAARRRRPPRRPPVHRLQRRVHPPRPLDAAARNARAGGHE